MESVLLTQIGLGVIDAETAGNAFTVTGEVTTDPVQLLLSVTEIV